MYKRQGHHSTNELAAASFVNNMFTLAIIFATGFSYGLTPIVGSLFGRGETHVAVSYTHLDVYKRQPLHFQTGGQGVQRIGRHKLVQVKMIDSQVCLIPVTRQVVFGKQTGRPFHLEIISHGNAVIINCYRNGIGRSHRLGFGLHQQQVRAQAVVAADTIPITVYNDSISVADDFKMERAARLFAK